ncbi:MAG TPA: GNAT family N-acetyltransferase [Candidatus Nitrosotalea sp.]|nr:GNAT family N-acetyltransferase [Candidatus Nitrosotalea sp.]
MDVVNRDYRPKYKKQILELFRKTYDKEMTKEFWNWRFEKYPFKQSLIRLSFFDEQLVAHYLLQPAKLLFKSCEIDALYSMTTMTDPNFSGQGLMTKLANEVYDIGRKLNYRFVYGFANRNSNYMFSKKLGFKTIVMPEFSIDVKNNSTTNSDYTCSDICNFDDSYSNFYEKYNKKYAHKIMRDRTADYMNWRFIRHPENKYKCYMISLNGETMGYFVLKNYNNIKCHIVDFLITDDPYCYDSMITTAINFCKNNGIKELTLWMNKTLSLYDHLSKMGLTENLMENYLVIKSLSPNIDLSEIEKIDNWYLTMADSDVY